MAANGISTLANKKLRQIAKLEQAKADRIARNVVEPGRYAVTEYDILELPTQYETDNSITDNPNVEGLLLGRPWNPGIPASDISALTLAAGVSRIVYNGYFGDTTSPYDDSGPYAAWIAGPPSVLSGPTYPTTVADSLSSGENNRTVIFQGYFNAPSTATYDLYIQSDDASYLWLGDVSLDANRTIANAIVSQPGIQAFGTPGVDGVGGTFPMVQNQYYALTIVYGNGPAGPGQFAFSYRENGVGASYTSDFTGRLFYNTATDGH